MAEIGELVSLLARVAPQDLETLQRIYPGNVHLQPGGVLGEGPVSIGCETALSALSAASVAAVRDCRNGDMHITRAKTEAGMRAVPVHPVSADIVKRRSEGKADDAYVFHELNAENRKGNRERSMPAVKAFVRYRRALGVVDAVEGRRQERVGFHSFRRWFITSAERAGVAPHILSTVVGHRRAGETLGRYSGGPSDTQERAVIEAVFLPAGINLPVPQGKPLARVLPRRS